MRFLLKNVANPEFQKLQQRSKQKDTFPLDRKSISTSWKEEIFKKYVSICVENSFHSQEYLTNWKIFYQGEKQFLFGAMKFFKKIGFHIVSIMVSTL